MGSNFSLLFLKSFVSWSLRGKIRNWIPAFAGMTVDNNNKTPHENHTGF